MTSQPLALIVEDSAGHGGLAELALSEAGFATVWVRSLLAGFDWVQQHLAVPPPQPTLILLDMKLPDPIHARLEGSVLATWLTEQMRTGTLHPALIVGITSESTPQREWEALAAGCATLLAKPLTTHKARVLHGLLADDAPLTSNDDVAVQAFRQQQLDVLRLILDTRQAAASSRIWSADDVRVLLGHLTPSLHLSAAERDHGAQLLAELGGITQARLDLKAASATLSTDQSRLLDLLLSGVPQQRIWGRHGIGRRKLAGQISTLLNDLALALTGT